ncbi:5-methylcytosine rRNA methyltransferase NSUN4 [Coccinella septempunctata]|uniref:5-methylcytosine rRNA methyltransferase NSUN4 n=1 Tax=Coccinella septempunctata TaxID=41139 RepID=UPI001D08CFDE|nr:5-methylcytosine rRNA methyltransferase NSUN4 [Coccinella septempunctata]
MLSNRKLLLKLNEISVHNLRRKHKPDHWSVVRKKVQPVDKALDHFDEFYGPIFGKKWSEIRAGLLSKQKYVAVVNNYGNAPETCEHLELKGALNVRKLFQLEKDYIEERYSKSKRLRNLLRIWQMDRSTEIDSENGSLDSQKDEKVQSFSIAESLKVAALDKDRIFDARETKSSELLLEFVPATEIKGNEDYIPEFSYNYCDENSDMTVRIEREFDIHFPENLNVYSYGVENDEPFDSPLRDQTDVYNYYLMDGGSIFPVLALDLRPNNTFLDMCAAPGGKSLTALQTLYPSVITSNDISKSRVDRIYNVYRQFLFDFDEKFLRNGRIIISRRDGRDISDAGFDRILVDVPCTTDRHSLKENDNNIFKPSRIKERLRLPELQSDLLYNALQLVKEGGIVVYSTCSLSPIQNDGVVHMTLKRIWEENKKEIVVKDLSPALLMARCLFKLASPKMMKYGHLVLPTRAQSFGPTYFCKLQRIK